MIKIVKDISFLSLKSCDATKDDLHIVNELRRALEENKQGCVGMASNMIGYNKNIIIFEDENKKYQIMINPTIIVKKNSYKTKEGCLSLDGIRECIRYDYIKVKYYDEEFKVKIKTYKGFTSQIIQHEIDHLNGIII